MNDANTMQTDELFTLPEKYTALRDEALAFAETCRPIAARCDEADFIDAEMRTMLKESGLADVMVPAAYGGRFEAVDSLAATVIREAFGTVSGHLDALFGMQGIGSFALSIAGSESVKQRWLPPVASLDAIAGLALTEPDVGSDLRALTTTMDVDGESLVINGAKSFITNAGDADFYTTLVREGDLFSAVLIPADAEGITISHPHQIIAPHVIGDIRFENVRVPLDHRIGEPGQGFKLILATLATFRVSVAGAAVGLAQAALDEMLRYTTEREAFGKPLSSLGNVAQYIGASWADIETARAITYRAAAAAARDPLGSLHLSSMAKAFSTEAAGRVTDRTVQAMGRFGLVRGGDAERLYRGARPMRIYEGATDVLYDALAKKLVKEYTK